MKNKLKILFIPIDAIGHMMPAIGMAEVLIQSGHRVLFVANDQWRGKLCKYGIEEIVMSEEDRQADGDPAYHYAKRLVEDQVLKASTPMESALNLHKKSMPIFIESSKKLDLKLEDFLPKIRPDVMVLDQAITFPSVIKSGIPWVYVCSANPLCLIDDERTPPAASGLPSDGHQNEWKAFRKAFKQSIADMLDDFSRYLVSRGVPGLKSSYLQNGSEYLNIYSFPLELDYTDIRPLPKNYYRFDNLMRTEKYSKFEIPDQLKGKSGKLVYFSLGSMGGADVELMKRLVAILAKSKHRFIVSKGPLHWQYELADNMWGQQSVPQIQVLPAVDLVVTHGGNNTVVETFTFGKPMIVMPLLADQFDNAQRVHEKGFGLRLDPYQCSEEELLNGIEMLLNNKVLNEKLKKISERIQSENSIGKLSELIESLVNNNEYNSDE